MEVLWRDWRAQWDWRIGVLESLEVGGYGTCGLARFLLRDVRLCLESIVDEVCR